MSAATKTKTQVSKAQAAQAALDGLLAQVRAGEDVDPLDISAAREAIALEALAEEGRQERAAEAAAAAAKAAAKALEGPLAASLSESGQIVHDARQHAFEAVAAFLTANQAYTDEAYKAAGQLIEAGYEQGDVQKARGYVQTVTLDGQEFEHFLAGEEVTAMLRKLMERFSFRTAGDQFTRDLERGIPIPIAEGPQKHLEWTD
jgi:surface antigen